MNAPTILAINGVRMLMEDTFATVTKAMNFRGKTHVLVGYITTYVFTNHSTFLAKRP